MLQYSTNIKADTFLGTDNLGQYYYLKNNILFKETNNQKWQYKNVILGKPTKIDFINPLKIIVFYENFNTVIFLDSQLNESEKINFSDSNSPILASAVGLASQNKLWIYNTISQKIELYDYIKNQCLPISTSLTDGLKYYETNFNTFSWIDIKNNKLNCSIYGIITNLGKIPNFNKIQFIATNDFIFLDNNILKFSISGKIYEFDNIDKTFESFYYNEQILSIFTNEEIKSYKIILP